MKTIVRILTTATAVMMLANFATAQADYTQDFCESASDPTVQYQAGNLESAGSSVLWTISGGGVLTNETLETCDVDWSGAAPGTYTITLRETHSSTLCWIEKTIDVTIHAKPVANFALTGSTVCNTEDASVLIQVTSTANWSLVYNDGSSDIPLTGNAGDNGTIDAINVTTDITYTLVSIENLGCTLAAGDNGTVGPNTTHDLNVAVLNPTISVNL